MNLLSVLRCLGFVFLLAFGSAFASEDKYYEGLLLPDDFAGPISVTVELRDLQGVLVGRVKAGAPFYGVAPVRSGEMSGEKCDVQVAFHGGAALRLTGTCRPGIFEGKYSQPGRRDAASRGTFRLLRKEPERDEEKRDPMRVIGSAASITDCLKSNTRCLSTCPQGDYNSEFLCANRCRTKFKACKTEARQP